MFLFAAVAVVSLLAGCHTADRVAPAPARAEHPEAPAVRFADVTQAAGIRFRHFNGAQGKKWLPETMGSGCAFLDYDRDGWLDILLVNGEPWASANRRPIGLIRPIGPISPNAQHATPNTYMSLYHNNHNGTFTEVTRSVGLDVPIYGMGVAAGDYDNDGYEDIFVTAVGPSHLFHNVPDNRGGRRFVDATRSAGIHEPPDNWSTSAAWVDYDRDGRLDLFVCHYVDWSPARDVFYSVDGVHKSYSRPQAYPGQSCRLYHNAGNGKFEDVTRSARIYNNRSKALGVTVSDYDGDGFPDIFVANDTEPNFLYHNQGDGTFREIGVEAGISLSEQGTSRAGMGIDTAYLQGGDSPDVLITNFAGEQLTLYRRDTSGLFLDVAARAGVGAPTQPYLGFGAFFFDYDLDGRQDLFITNGHIDDDIAVRGTDVRYREPCLLFHNVGNDRFEDVTDQSGVALTVPRVGRGACFGDYDNDGSPDVLIETNDGPPALLHNENRTNNGWVRVVLTGRKSNRDAIGARVRVTVRGQTLTQEVRSGSSYLSSSDRRLLFGLGSAPQADGIEIRWPSGKVEERGLVARNQTVVIREGE